MNYPAYQPLIRSEKEGVVSDNYALSISHLSHGEMKREIAAAVGCDSDRYAASTGTERHKRLTKAEVAAISDALGLGFLDESRQQLMDSIMLKLGRDHRTGARSWDASDIRAVHAEVVD